MHYNPLLSNVKILSAVLPLLNNHEIIEKFTTDAIFKTNVSFLMSRGKESEHSLKDDNQEWDGNGQLSKHRQHLMTSRILPP